MLESNIADTLNFAKVVIARKLVVEDYELRRNFKAHRKEIVIKDKMKF